MYSFFDVVFWFSLLYKYGLKVLFSQKSFVIWLLKSFAKILKRLRCWFIVEYRMSFAVFVKNVENSDRDLRKFCTKMQVPVIYFITFAKNSRTKVICLISKLNSNSTAEAENWSTDNSQQTTGFGFESNLCLWSQTCRLG